MSDMFESSELAEFAGRLALSPRRDDDELDDPEDEDLDDDDLDDDDDDLDEDDDEAAETVFFIDMWSI